MWCALSRWSFLCGYAALTCELTRASQAPASEEPPEKLAPAAARARGAAGFGPRRLEVPCGSSRRCASCVCAPCGCSSCSTCPACNPCRSADQVGGRAWVGWVTRLLVAFALGVSKVAVRPFPSCLPFPLPSVSSSSGTLPRLASVSPASARHILFLSSCGRRRRRRAIS